MPHLTFRTSSKVKKLKVKVIRSLWVAVQVTTCRGGGQFVAAELQTTQLVVYSVVNTLKHQAHSTESKCRS